MARMMELNTPLGKDLLFRELRGREELGRPSAFELSALSTRADIKPSDLLGKSVTVKLELVKGGFRYFNGYVTRFSQGTILGKYYEYQMTRERVALVPHAHRRLQDLPGEDGPRDHQGSLR